MTTIRGKYLILAILFLAITLSLIPFLYHTKRLERTFAYYGRDACSVILNGSEADILLLAPIENEIAKANAAEEEIVFRGKRWRVTKRLPATKFRGLPNLRHLMVNDPSYLWDEAEPAGLKLTWDYVLECREGKEVERILFDLESARIAHVGSDKSVALLGQLNTEYKNFFAENMAGGKKP